MKHSISPSQLNSIAEQLDCDITTCEKIGRQEKQVWSINSKNSLCVLKTNLSSNSISLKHLINSHYMNKEIQVYKELNDKNLQHFKIARLVESSAGHYLLMEKILNSKRGWHRGYVSHRQLANALLELHQVDIKLKQDNPVGRFLEFKNKLSVKLIIWCFSRILFNLGLYAFSKTIKCIISCCMKQNKYKSSLFMHNDFLRRNNIMTGKSGLYFIDFESAGPESKWILQDVLHVSLFQNKLKVNEKLCRVYLNNLFKSNEDFKNVNISVQLRMALLHRFMARILPEGKHVENHRKMWFDFYNSTLLNDKAYEKWFCENIKI